MSSAEIALSKGRDGYIGTTVAGRYEVVSRIGAGGMGMVYRAKQTLLGRDVALKLLKDEVAWDAETVTRFQREAKAMSLLQSQNTVRVFDFGQTDKGILFLAMEMLEGETLGEYLKRVGMVDPAYAVRIIQQVLTSLKEAHAKGIVHRDLKPDNIVLAESELEDRVVKVLDFGIAKVFDGDNDFDALETQAGTVFGTPRYMSPEQAQGKKLDARSDLYSVGVLLFHLLTGVPPFRDDDAVVVMAQHIRDAPESPMALAPTAPISRKLNALVLRAMAKSPDRRYQSASEFIGALEECLPGLAGARGGTTGVFRRAVESPKRSALVALLLLIGAAAIAVIFFSLLHVPTEPTETPQAPNTATQQPTPPPTTPLATIASSPEGAEVWQGDNLLGHTPFEIELDDGSTLDVELRLEGYQHQPAEIIAGALRTIALNEEVDEVVPRLPNVRPTRMRRPGSAMSQANTAAESASETEDYSRLDF